MNVQEHDLPGVGKKFACTTNEGDRLTLIIHNTGHRELYFFERGEDFPTQALRLEDAEARKLGALMGGAYFQPAVAESMEMVLGQLSVDWLPLQAGSPLADKTLANTRMREQTGASIIAIIRGGEAQPNPQPSEMLRAGDTLMVIGSRDQVRRAAEAVRGGPARGG
ncbi:cation:proton antiporter regulatory subunit [Longimicrobium sp.]|uniref:cation:proton antiporter regulatory subunit n=1 Tax=Longimicrobium sp. TaxID=2029185 RepID=UPI003B39FE00